MITIFIAKRENGEKIHLLYNCNEELLRRMRQQERFFCVACGKEVQMKLGKQKSWHFAHKKVDSCLAFYEAESMYHRHGKELLYRWFERQNFHVDIEHYLPQIQQRPDIFIERAGRKIAIEYQCANLSIEQLYKRTYSYWRAGIQVIWIIGGNQLKKQSAYWMKFSSLMAFSLQSYPQPFLIFFCSKQKSFMKCAFLTSFSTSVSFSHTIYLPTETTTFELLFSPVPFQKEILDREWKQRKDYFRKNALPIWNYNYKSLLRLLYQFKCTPASFPSEIGVPLPSGFAFQTNPFIWQAFLYMKCIGELAVGECISLQYVCSYVKKYTKRRMLPYFSKHIWKVAVTEYMTFLCYTGVLRKVETYKYRKIRGIVMLKTEEEVMKYDETCLAYALSLFEAKYNMREGKGDIIKTDCEGIT
ncbi:competence protein CoiA family protein [Bacillus thuringiensis]|uniref:competence protein CoiA n=1 Tax=Bacillus cereus group TaxID=86661 RepID=UPI000A369CE2|nr:MULTISPECIES: competence protein CoiA family protein [Bacillus cereus group]MEC2704751.1 competence protein CoiA family protein [Bacillus thuringiensis]OUB67101.1 competence protein [Bacillus thuringiensis serovar dakota]PRT02962.1 competence protein [Bacillus thuringiensis]UPJ17591.1 competence protein [Bacillus cereus]